MRWSSVFSIFIFLKFVFIGPVAAEEARPLIGNVGRAAFALTAPTFQCNAFLRSMRRLPVWHVAALYHTFGDSYRCWDRLVANPKLQTIELNLINEPGHRNRRLGSYEFLAPIKSPSEYDKLLRARDPALKARFVKYIAKAKEKITALPPHVQCLINPGLESNVSTEAGKVLVAWSKEHFPRCRIVWNPLVASMKGSTRAGADLVEGHGPLPPVQPACLVNLDGTDIDFPNRRTKSPHGNYIQSGRPLQQYIHSYVNKCELVFLWVVEDNCTYSTFIDPRKRNCSKAADVFPLVAREAEIALKTIKVFSPYKWTEEEQASLNSCSDVRAGNDGAKRGFLLKQSEFRDRGGVVILPADISASKVEIVSKGKVIDSYEYTGRYNHDNSNRPLWRSDATPINYAYHVVVRLKTSKGNVCYKIENPKERVD